MRPYFDLLMQDARRRLNQAARSPSKAAPRVTLTRAEPSVCMLEGKAGRKARTAARKELAAQNRLNKRILIKKAAKITKGSARPHTDKVGKITRAQAEEIAKMKEPDLTAADLDAAVRTIAGSARSMGITVEGL